ncbi:MAG: N-acetylglucosamine-6-phosphate deacetylase [Ruminococcaceae bacterium]|nr:N-acetylglucosamine-6-phosphate deacetylase [Oscillospiraceae bacterium]
MMVIGNANVLIDGKFTMASVTVAEDKIAQIGAPDVKCDVDAGGAYLVPGFVDIHTHGAMNEDFSDGKPSGLNVLSEYYAKNGVTSFLATTMTLKEEALLPAMEAVRDFVRPAGGAKCAGIHLEGPFLSYAKRGAQAAENLHAPDGAMFHRLNAASGNQVRLVTVAPEEPGAVAFIREVSKTCTVSLGHTTADYDTAMAAFQAGASHATHLFNGMPSFLHREPGVVGAAADSGATVELICDGLHIHPSVIRAAYRIFGKNLAVISDSLRCAGMPDGEYELGGQPIEMKKGKATLLGTDTLAGSSTNLLQEVRNLVTFGIPLEAAITAVTETPARAVGLDGQLGKIAPGYRADLLLLTKDLDLSAVYIDGKCR